MLLIELIVEITNVLFLVLLGLSTSAHSEDAQILELLKNQFEAFNNRNIEQLVNNVTDDFKWYSLTSDQLLVETADKESFKKAMISYYKSRPNKSTSVIESYTIDGNRVSFKEVVSHTNKKGETVSSSALGIYQMKNGKIFRAWYFID